MTLDRREIVAMEFPAVPATVWKHLRDPELVRRWYRWDAPDLDEHVAAFVAGTEGHDAAGRHTLTWPNHDVLTLGPAGGHPEITHLSVTRRSHEVAGFDGVYDYADAIWVAGAEQLRFAVTVQPGQPRRTLSVFGLDAGDRRERLLDRAGLHGVRGIPVGSNVQARRPDGTLLGGTLLHKSDELLVLHVHGITAALLVLVETPAASAPPHGTVGAVMSTYGLDDETFAQVESRWSDWWRMAGARPR
ncbi:hypothetical protein [Cellulomonas edaphi]|uniref:SRPBCC domain-containing protein n=1 Tax=Cellulomonas edaphi TaxID=3053468 RepID=A0ABT7S2V3_9CELL|nr:hypothetical protein [Cellulomons edaphi]MDM7829943.1 hypothetical protein [Cellulomons edaphi]